MLGRLQTLVLKNHFAREVGCFLRAGHIYKRNQIDPFASGIFIFNAQIWGVAASDFPIVNESKSEIPELAKTGLFMKQKTKPPLWGKKTGDPFQLQAIVRN